MMRLYVDRSPQYRLAICHLTTAVDSFQLSYRVIKQVMYQTRALQRYHTRRLTSLMMRLPTESLSRHHAHDSSQLIFFFFTLVTGPRRSLSLTLSDTDRRLTSLMMRLYVDRSPQSSAPQILYTRIWSKVFFFFITIEPRVE